MKKILVAIAAMSLAFSANAQVGVIAGLTSSHTNIKSAVGDAKSINQYHIGLAYKLDLGLVAIQPALIYNMKGSSIEDISGTGLVDASIDMKTGFLELPVQIQVGNSMLGLARIYGFAEPYIGYAVSNETSYKVAAIKGTSKGWDNVKNRLEYGVGLGVGAEVLKHIQVSARYFWDLGNVYGYDGKVNDNITLDGIAKSVGSTKCNGISVSVAFLF